MREQRKSLSVAPECNSKSMAGWCLVPPWHCLTGHHVLNSWPSHHRHVFVPVLFLFFFFLPNSWLMNSQPFFVGRRLSGRAGGSFCVSKSIDRLSSTSLYFFFFDLCCGLLRQWCQLSNCVRYETNAHGVTVLVEKRLGREGERKWRVE